MDLMHLKRQIKWRERHIVKLQAILQEHPEDALARQDLFESEIILDGLKNRLFIESYGKKEFRKKLKKEKKVLLPVDKAITIVIDRSIT